MSFTLAVRERLYLPWSTFTKRRKWTSWELLPQPPRKKGRGKKAILAESPLASYAREQGLPLLQPNSARDPGFLAELGAWKPDVCVTCAYGQILDQRFLDLPTRGVINIHPSALPQFRGATPVPATILSGADLTAVTILFTVLALDAGHIILQEDVRIEPEETAGKLLERLLKRSGPLLVEALRMLEDPNFSGFPQDSSRVSHCRRLSKEDGKIDWSQPAALITRAYRAYEPWPGVYTFLGERRIQLGQVEATAAGEDLAGEPGRFRYDRDSNGLLIATGEGQLVAPSDQARGSTLDRRKVLLQRPFPRRQTLRTRGIGIRGGPRLLHRRTGRGGVVRGAPPPWPQGFGGAQPPRAYGRESSSRPEKRQSLRKAPR